MRFGGGGAGAERKRKQERLQIYGAEDVYLSGQEKKHI